MDSDVKAEGVFRFLKKSKWGFFYPSLSCHLTHVGQQPDLVAVLHETGEKKLN